MGRLSQSGTTWPLTASDRWTLFAGVRIEDHHSWTQAANDALTDENNRGLRTNMWSEVLPWASGNVLDLEMDETYHRALILAYSSPGTEPTGAHGIPYSQAGMWRLPYFGHSLAGFSVSPDRTKVAAVEFWGHPISGALTTIDTSTLERRVITQLDQVSGAEVPLWSSDSQWIIVPGSPPNLIGLRDELKIELSFSRSPYETQADWWSARGDSTVFLMLDSPPNQRLAELDLSTGEVTEICKISEPQQPDLEDMRRLLHRPRMSPTGDDVLVSCRFGPSQEYQSKYGSRERVARLNPLTGELTQDYDAFVDGTIIEREHSKWRWNRSTPEPRQVHVADSLIATSVPFESEDLAPRDDDQRESLWLWIVNA